MQQCQENGKRFANIKNQIFIIKGALVKTMRKLQNQAKNSKIK